MSIASSITGIPAGNEASQVLTLLSVMADPVAYNKKLNDLIEATEANKKFAELAGPASEIIEIRKEIEADKAAAKSDLADARRQASSLVADANKKAKSILAEANQKSDEIIARAQKKQEEAEAALEVARLRSIELDSQVTMIASREAELAASVAEVEKLREETLSLQKEYESKAEELQKKIAAFASALG
jgi:F0F1-type ATP synthase membrane subunit b/b'